MTDTDYWRTLGLDLTASPEQVRQRYLELVRRFPPDQAPDRFREISAAYSALSNPLVSMREALLGESGNLDSVGQLIARESESLPKSRIRTDDLLDMARRLSG